MTLRNYHELTAPDRSGLLAQVVEQRERVRERLRDVRHVIAVMSGKGGVGKSYVTAGLALYMAPRTGAVGVLDADLKSPTAARLLDAKGPLRVEADGVQPARGRGGVKVVSTDLLLDEGTPLRWQEPASTDRFVWRGLLEAATLREFLSDVSWGPLELLLVDMPPDTSRLEDLGDFVPNLTGVLAVTIPSEESRRSVERAMCCATDLHLPILGVVENMSGYACGRCAGLEPLFAGDAGERLASDFGVPLLARLPFVPEAAREVGPSLLGPLADRMLRALT